MVSTIHDKNRLPEKLFEDNAKKSKLNQISPNPLIPFCRNFENEKFTGDNLPGFSTKFCQDFYPAPTYTGICITKNLDMKKIVDLDKVYYPLFEAEKHTSELTVERDNYWAVNTFIINPLKIDPRKVIFKFNLHSNFILLMYIIIPKSNLFLNSKIDHVLPNTS